MTDIDREERALYVLLILVALPAVVRAAVAGGPVGGGTTLCLAMLAIGVIGLVGRQVRRVPRAVARTLRKR